MDWRDIPSLSALRAFEAAARLGSYSEAARSLNVTHAAIAQHVRSLEAHFGQPLMQREGRAMAVTEAGRRLHRDVAAGFGEIATGVRALMRERADAPISLTTTQSFAENWLMPRMAQFWATHPGVTVSVSVDNRVIDLRRSEHHLGIRFGAGDWPGLTAEKLTSGQSVIVATPEVAARLPKGLSIETEDGRAAMSAMPWVTDTLYAEFLPWLAAQGFDPEALNRTDLKSNTLVLAACRAGAGLSVQTTAVVERDLAEGRLVALSDRCDQSLGYWIVRAPGPEPAALKAFLKWLRSVA
jgi:LysR family glycine cleavage system transcriptional activator